MRHSRLLWRMLGLGLALALSGCVVSPKPPSPPPAVPGASQTLSEVFLHLQLDYSDRNSLDPKKLVTSVLRELEREFPEVELRLQASSNKSQIRVRVSGIETLLPIPPPDSLEQAHHSLQRLAQSLRDSAPPQSPQRVEQALARGVGKVLDPHSVWMPQAAFREFRNSVTGEYAGLGMVVGLRNNQLEVIELMEGSPAQQSGLQPGDRLVKIGTEEVAHMTQEEILRRLRGKAGTAVALEMARPDVVAPLRFELIRSVVESPSVEAVDMQEGGWRVRLLRLERFQQGTAEEVQTQLRGITEQDGLILDLRGNPGGILEAATDVADLLLSGGLRVVSTQGPTAPRSVQSRHRLDPEAWRSVPLVVLVNDASASASEVLAAALQQHKRGAVLGQRTYGKGSIQATWPHQDGSGLKLTIGQYLTPDGSSLHGIGVIPDVELVPVDPDAEQFAWWSPDELDPPSSSGKPTVFAHRLRLLVSPQKPATSDQQAVDNSIKLARRLLQQARQSGNTPVDELSRFVRQVQQEQEEEFTKAAALQRVDWSLPAEETGTSEVSARLQVQRSSPEQLELHLTLRNDNAYPVHRVVGVLHSPLGTIDQRQWAVGRIPGGETRDLALTLPLPKYQPTYTAPIRLKLLDHSGKKIGEARTLVFPVPAPKLALALSVALHEDGSLGSIGNGNGQPDPGETLALELSVENTTEQAIGPFIAELHDRSGSVRVNRGRVQWDALNLGQSEAEVLRLVVPAAERPAEPLRLTLHRPAFPDTRVVWEFSLAELSVLGKARVPVFASLGVDHSPDAQDSGRRLRLVPKNRDRLRDLVVFLNDRKVLYQPYGSTEKTGVETLLELESKPGLNRVEVLLRGKSGLSLRRTLRFWQPKLSGSS